MHELLELYVVNIPKETITNLMYTSFIVKCRTTTVSCIVTLFHAKKLRPCLSQHKDGMLKIQPHILHPLRSMIPGILNALLLGKIFTRLQVPPLRTNSYVQNCSEMSLLQQFKGSHGNECSNDLIRNCQTITCRKNSIDKLP